MTTLLQPSSVLRLTLILSAGACAAGGAIRVSDVTPQQIPSLEAEKSRRPQDPNTLARLGVAYFKAERYADARPVLDSAVARDPSNGVAAIYLGMTAEQLGDFATAKQAYQSYINLATNSELKSTAQQRLALVDRRQMEYQARQALANEAALATMPPESNTVAVMPFNYSGTNAEIRPLTRGLAQLLVTDLAKSRQLRVLERERMQAILDELKLSDSGRAAPAAALRSGRLLRAARVVQGSLMDLPSDQLQVSAVVVDVATSGAGSPASGEDQLSRLFDLEKQIAYSIFSAMGVQLSPGEQEAINQRPTQNVQAFLAYSRGLVALDQGNYGAAQADFNDAVNLDPSFRAAAQGASEAGELSAASQQTVAQTEQVVSRVEQIQAPPPTGPDATQTALSNGADATNPTSGSQTAADISGGTETGSTAPSTDKKTTAEATGTDKAGPPTGNIIIIIKRP
jgi:tetratricopeptide (TPR) repeat protein